MESNLKSRKLNKLALKILNNKFKNFKAILILKSNKMFRILNKKIKKINNTMKNKMNKLIIKIKGIKSKKIFNLYKKTQSKIKE